MNEKSVKLLLGSNADMPIFFDALRMEAYEHRLVHEAHKACLKLCEANYLDALQKSTNFQFVERQHRGQYDTQRTAYRTRVRFRYGTTVQAEWYIAELVKRDFKDALGKIKSKWVVERKDPTKNANGEYSKYLFRKSPQWVQLFGTEAEECYKIVRRRNALLSEIRDKLYELDRLNRKLFDRDDTVRARQSERPEPINQEYLQTILDEIENERA